MMHGIQLQQPDKLRQCISEYNKLCNLDGYTRQARGQRFNSLIAEVLSCWGIRAIPDTRSAGEIDVAFELKGTRFILEAKWKSSRSDTGPIAKLQKRVRQRLAGTIGIFLSMEGFTQDALRDIKEGERLEILLLEKFHFEAILTGFFNPEEILNTALDKAHFFGDPHLKQEDLFPPSTLDTTQVLFKNHTLSPFLSHSQADYTIHPLISSMPQLTDITILTDEKILVIHEGTHIVSYDYKKHHVQPWCSVIGEGQLAHIIGHTPTSAFLARRHGVVLIEQNTNTYHIQFVAGAFPKVEAFFQNRNNEVWGFASSDYMLMEQRILHPSITCVPTTLSAQQPQYFDDTFHSFSRLLAMYEDSLLVERTDQTGNAFELYKNGQKQWSIPHKDLVFCNQVRVLSSTQFLVALRHNPSTDSITSLFIINSTTSTLNHLIDIHTESEVFLLNDTPPFICATRYINTQRKGWQSVVFTIESDQTDK